MQLDLNDELIDMLSPATVSEAIWDAAGTDIEDIMKRTGLTGGRALVIPRGTGQHAVALANLGFTVTAVGPADEALELARQRAEEDHVEIEFLICDPEAYQPEGHFDLVLNLSSSFNFVHGVGEGGVLAALQSALKPSGWAVLRMVNLDSSQRRVDVKDWREGPEGMLVLEELEHDWERGWVSYRWLIVTRGGERFEFQLGHRGYDAKWICTTMFDAGFDQVDLVGALDGTPFGPETPVVIYAQV